MIPLLILLTACGPSPDAFQRKADREVCMWMQSCFDEDYDQCIAQAEASWELPPESCDYDRSAARDCVAGLERLDCPSDGLLHRDVGMPPDCSEVWDCDG